MPQTLLVLPMEFAPRLPGILISDGNYLARDRETPSYRQLTFERGRGRVTVTFITSPEWLHRLDETLPENAIVVGVQRSGWRFWRRWDDRELHRRVVALLAPYAVSAPMRIGNP
jgi:hypothetical protein